MPVLMNPDAAAARAKMRRVFAKAEQDIIDEINRKRLAGYVDYGEVAALERVQKILADMSDEVEEYFPKYVEKVFYKADKDLAGYGNAGVLTSTQIDIEQQLVNNLMGEIAEASSTAFESAQQALLVGRAEEGLFREAMLTAVLQGEATGSFQKTATNLAVDLQQRGLTAYVDKAGRQWKLTDYCDMCVRTTARQAEVAAALTSDDWDLWQITARPDTCELCAAYQGRVYSKSGTDPDYPPLWQAFGKIDINGSNDLANTYLNIHPNCMCSLVRYTTAGKTDAQIQREKDFSSFEKRPADVDYRSKRSREAYREKEKARAKLLRDRDQWKRYKAALGDDVPGFEAFRRNKLAGSKKYQKLESEYRSLRASG